VLKRLVRFHGENHDDPRARAENNSTIDRADERKSLVYKQMQPIIVVLPTASNTKNQQQASNNYKGISAVITVVIIAVIKKHIHQTQEWSFY
jgi:hypothetical protein